MNIGDDEPRPQYSSGGILSEDQKKGLHQKWNTFFPKFKRRPKKKGLHQKWNTFSPNSSGHQRSDAHQSQIIGGDADVDHTQTIRGIYPPIPLGFGTPARDPLKSIFASQFKRKPGRNG